MVVIQLLHRGCTFFREGLRARQPAPGRIQFGCALGDERLRCSVIALAQGHLRFGPEPITAPYLVNAAGFIGVHHWSILERVDVLKMARPGTVVLVNSHYSPEELFAHLPQGMQRRLIELGCELWTIDANAVAREAGMGNRTNTVLQTCFFAISKVMPREAAIEAVKESIRKTYGRRGADVVAKNEFAVDAAIAHLHRVEVPDAPVSDKQLIPPVPEHAPEFVREVTAQMLLDNGDGAKGVETLRKAVDNPAQSGLTDAEHRRANVLGVYEALPENVRDKRLLLIDDIVTTGSTLTECVRVLRAYQGRSDYRPQELTRGLFYRGVE